MSEKMKEIIEKQKDISMRLSNVLVDCPRCKYSFWIREEDLEKGKEKDVEEMTDCGKLNIGGEEIHAIDRVRIK